MPHSAGAAPSAEEADSALAADLDYAAGRAALKAGHVGDALRHFQVALRRFPDAADLHNELGYGHRKLRRFREALHHYHRALEIDPRHRGAHEYIGETYLLVGNLEGAQRHLAELQKICLLPCEEYQDLLAAVKAHRDGVARE